MSIMQEAISSKQAYRQLSEKDRAFIDRINAVDMGNRKIRASEMLLIRDVADGDSLELFLMAVRYGFIKGQLAEKARKAKVGRKAVV